VFADQTFEKEFSYAGEAQKACENIGMKFGSTNFFATVLGKGDKSINGVQIRYKDDLLRRPFENKPPPNLAVRVWKWEATSGGPFQGKRTIAFVEAYTSKGAAYRSVKKGSSNNTQSLDRAIAGKTAWMGYLWTDSDKSP
jgi:hypothetical protein